MKRQGLALIACIIGLFALMLNEASAQALRAERTFFVKPRIGLSNYHGDLTENFTFAFDKEIPYSAGLELGYQFTRGFSMSGQTSIGRFASLSPHMNDDDRVFHNLILRYTGRASTATVAPFIQGGIQGTDGLGEISIGPAIGAGLDIALSDQMYLFLEFMTAFSVPDDYFDDDASEKPEFDFLTYLGPALKYNFKSPFTAVEVMNIECPSGTLDVGESATFTATTNSDVASQPVTYTWGWGDNTSASGSVASKSFNRAGNYTVTFTATNNGHTETATCNVAVSAVPQAAEIVTMNASQTRFELCEPVTVDFDADVRGDSPLTYQWDFGDGSTGIGEDASHTYTEPGTYTVTLRVSNPQGETTRTMTVVAERCTAGICYEVTEMNSVYFGRNSSTLTAEGRAALAENLEIFEECPNLCAEIIGYAAPGERSPQQLSADRADAVEQYYMQNGIAASRFVTEGRGAVGETSKKEGGSQFRRVDTIPMQCVDLD